MCPLKYCHVVVEKMVLLLTYSVSRMLGAELEGTQFFYICFFISV